MHRFLLLDVVVLLTAALSRAGGADLASTAREAAQGATTAEGKVRAVTGWVHQNFRWTYTDYKKRTVAEILERKGGNCNEQAVVVVGLLNQLGVKTRRVREINIQPENPARQRSAEELVAKNGNRSSVFGLRHNDHVWIEFRDEASGEWLPADPTLNLVGLRQWVKARAGFDPRPTHAILPSRDMLVPIAIYAVEGDKLESRTEHYLIDGFNAAYGGKLAQCPSWSAWVKEIRAVDPICGDAFAGKANLHVSADRIEALAQIYKRLRAEQAGR